MGLRQRTEQPLDIVMKIASIAITTEEDLHVSLPQIHTLVN